MAARGKLLEGKMVAKGHPPPEGAERGGDSSRGVQGGVGPAPTTVGKVVEVFDQDPDHHDEFWVGHLLDTPFLGTFLQYNCRRRLSRDGDEKKSDIAKDFGIPRNTLSTYLKNKEKILRSESECDKGRKRLREPGNPDLDKCVLKWFKQARDKKIPVSGHLIRSKAEQFATEMGKTDFKASSGWLDGFKERNKISFKTICGESGAVNLQVAEQWKNNLRELIQDKDARDVFNVDETGLFFKCTPDKTLAFKHENCHGGKLSKERVTLLVIFLRSGC
ncbi:hypothetical protein LAZ67_9000425 [Cordylochernes scorpioides]|uniref:HTH CENPB-type domain-containing protein n=1 Tax=Cordylochernes scorpioides TaxID=51811 RepID=A0ABY6KSH8_9ARAC|nr:hypothetical protein LAZ67_9000425 [Cordylochernes scorpioides]